MTKSLMHLKQNTTVHEFSRLLLEKGPIFWSEADQFWVVTDHAMASTILKSDDFSADRSGYFKSRLSQCPFHKVANFFGVVKNMMVTSDRPHHTARRKLASFGINDHVVDEFAPKVEQVVTELVRSCRSREEFDFVETLALPLPNIVLADLFSVPADERPQFYRWANDMTQFFGGATDNIEVEAEHADHGAVQLRQYFTGLIADRRRKPTNDFLSRLLEYQNTMGLDDDEVISQAVIMLVAGTVTTTDQMANILNTLLQNPHVLAEVRQGSSELLDRALEEATRLDPAVGFLFRVATQDMALGGSHIKAGQLVFMSVAAANRNLSIFSNPYEFQLHRKTNPHLSYGSGIHYCLGAKLGRIQIKKLFETLFNEFSNLQLVGQPVRKHQSLAFSGFESLRLRTRPLLQEVAL